MFSLQVHIDQDKVIIRELSGSLRHVGQAAERALIRSAEGVFREAQAFLSGAGAIGRSQRGPRQGERTGFTKKSGEEVKFSLLEGAGGYPVPRRTGFLSQALDWLPPGKSKTGESRQGAEDVLVTTAGNEALIYDTAEYARTIHEGSGSSAKFGPRRYIVDGLEKYNESDRIRKNFEEELEGILPN